MTTKSKTKKRDNSAPPSQTIESGVVYTLDDFRKRTGLGDFAMRQARRNGLIVHYTGVRGFVIGDDWIDFLQTVNPDQESS